MTVVAVGQRIALEAQWLDKDLAPIGGSGSVTIRSFSGSTERWWDGSAWVTTPTSLPTTYGSGVHRLLLTVPALWQDLLVEVTHSLAGQIDQAETLSVGVLVSSRSTPSDVTTATAAVPAGVRTELATELARVDVATSTRSTPAQVTAARDSVLTAVAAIPAAPTPTANASAVRTELAPELARVDVATSTRSTPAQVAAVTSAVLTAVGTPAQDGAMTAGFAAHQLATDAALQAIAQQMTDLAAASLDDATTAQITSARDLILAAVSAAGANRVRVEVQP